MPHVKTFCRIKPTKQTYEKRKRILDPDPALASAKHHREQNVEVEQRDALKTPQRAERCEQDQGREKKQRA